MEILKTYEPSKTEEKWYQYWLDHRFFESKPDHREPFTIVIPPPNVTGVLHMGHMLNNTIQDILIRRARMQGKNACWVPGTDHAAIATEAKVVARLKERGIQKSDISRKEFLAHCWDWTHEHGGIILGQLKKLGASCDWTRTKFTMDDDLSESVIKVFVDLYEKGLIYRGIRMVNWDPEAQTAVSDEEVNHREEQSKLYFINYAISGGKDTLTVATTRPETLLGDTAICLHPNDERFKHLHGKKAIVPLVNREIPIILDEYVDMEFGTGCLKVTPAHDINDYELGQKHNLEVIDIIADNGTLNEKAQLFVGSDRFKARKEIVKELETKGLLSKIEEITNKVGRSERTNAVIEPKLSMQWFLKMEQLAKPALENVMNDIIQFHPAKFKNLYKHWMENINDWCLSRQLWWGHRVPAWYNDKNEFVVAATKEEAIAKFKQEGKECNPTTLKQDEDALDTWFSSWLWPISVFDGVRNPNNEDFKYYYPTNDLVTGFDIMFFWVARMIIAGYEVTGEKPFKNVYYTGMVRDKIGRKMSKSLGNSPDALKLIEDYSADGVRVGMLLTAPAGNDLPFDPALCEQGRNFSNKIWNSLRLVKGWEVDTTIQQPDSSRKAIEWFDAKFNEVLEEINESFSKYRISEALMTSYKLIWDEFCAWYLEIVKPAYQQPIDKATYDATIANLDRLMRLIHPFMPFISEEIWQLIGDREKGESIVLCTWPEVHGKVGNTLTQFELVKEVIAGVRTVRKEKNIPQKEPLALMVKANDVDHKAFDEVIKKLCNLSALSYIEEKVDNAFGYRVKANEYYVPVGDSIDKEAEAEKIKKELEYTKGFLMAVTKKLSNERFVNSAPEQVVVVEKKKQADAEAKIKVLEEQLASLV